LRSIDLPFWGFRCHKFAGRNQTKLFHLILGLLLALVFLLTGQYMHVYMHHMVGVPDAPRLLYRTRHIFILLAGLLNLGLGAYLIYRPAGLQRWLQWLGSGLIVTASVLFVIALFYDSTRGDLKTPWTHRAVTAIAIGTLIHLISAFGRQESTD
jgi:glucan phosphoethanolaminetransferase (alkaline phosphatase superfamily)